MYRLHIKNEKFSGWVRVGDNQMSLTDNEEEATEFKLADAHAYIVSLSEHSRSTFLLKPVPKVINHRKDRED